MTVQCPRCSTQYRVPEARLADPRPVFKCTRCNHVFSRGEKPARGRGRSESRNLAFPFAGGSRADTAAGRRRDDRRADAEGPATALEELEEGDALAAAGDDEEEVQPEAEGVEEEYEDDAEEEEPEEQAPARAAPIVRRPEPPPPRRRREPDAEPVAERPPSRSAGGRPSEPAFVADLPREREAAAPRSEARAASRPPSRSRRPEPPPELDDELEVEDDAPDGPLLIKERGRAERGPVQPRRRGAAAPGRSPLRPIAIGVGVVVAAFLVLAAVLSQRPDLAFERLGAVPLLGRLLGDDHLLVWRLQIGGVESSIDHIKGDKAALVVSGHVLNTTSQNLRLIEVEGRLLSDGVERRRQVVYAANQFRKTIRDLSASEVEMLLRLEPNRRFIVRPGESASFLIVFPNPPDNATEVTCRVVDARPA